MGCHENITHNTFPKQYSSIGKRTKVVFHFNTKYEFEGTIIRDDAEAPGETIIQLDDGRVVLASECQYEA